MTKTQAIREIKLMANMTAKATGYGGEIRVAVRGPNQEAGAYYTDSPIDAIQTARAWSLTSNL